MNIILTESLKQSDRILEPGTRLDLPEPKALKLIELGCARKPTSPEAPSCPETGSKQATLPEEPPEPEKGGIPNIRDVIARMLDQGPKPYREILAACGGNEDTLRESIRGWSELVAYDRGGTWTWKVESRLAWKGGLPKIPKKRHKQDLHDLFGAFPKGGKT